MKQKTYKQIRKQICNQQIAFRIFAIKAKPTNKYVT